MYISVAARILKRGAIFPPPPEILGGFLQIRGDLYFTTIPCILNNSIAFINKLEHFEEMCVYETSLNS